MKERIKNIVYAILDVAALNRGIMRRINGYQIRFPARYSRYYTNGYEKDTFDFFKDRIKPGNTILDIGAHIGLYTVPFSTSAGKDGKVFSFEPTPGTYKILVKTISANKLPNVFPVNAAIAEKNGILTFNLTSQSGEGSNANSLVQTGRSVSSVQVKAYSIDEFRDEKMLKVDVLKIDVEGAELLALKGARKTFLEDRPLGILALHPSSIQAFGHSLESIWDCLMEYRLNVHFKGKPISREEFCRQAELFDVEFLP